ncbi:crAss001_48 related protein [Acinetobacter nosocomialis]
MENFLDKGQPKFIDDEQWALLHEQQKHMDAYSDVLAKRIALF